MYNWVTSLYSRDWHNIVLINHLYFNKKIVVKNKNKNLQKLRYNLQMIKFTIWKCTVQWYLAYPSSCATITTI